LPDANGIRLPAGFTSRVVASSGQPVGNSVWHPYPDGGATFSLPDGGWIYVSNSEVPGAGTLEAAVATPIVPVDPADPRWTVTWLAVPNPNPTPADTPTRQQLPATTAFNGGEGCWYDTDTVYFTTKGDNRVWALDAATSVLELVYDDDLAVSPVLTGVDNVVANAAGELFVAEDGGDMQIVVIAPDRTFAPLLQIVGQDGSEITGPAFDPSGTRLSFSSQRGPGAGTGAGVTYEVRGPFRGGPSGVPAADNGLLSGLVHGAVEPPVRSIAPPVADVVHAVDRGLAGLGL
jgi:hypothetical protein